MTSDLERRVSQRKTTAVEGFTSRYNIHRLVWYATTESALDAVTRERQFKGWRRAKKVELVDAENPGWADLSKDWYVTIELMHSRVPCCTATTW